jgi:cell division protein ZipA
MDELRLILLGVGAIIIIMIYLWGMRSRIKQGLARRRRVGGRAEKDEPVLGDDLMVPPSADEVPDLRFREERPFAATDPFADQRLVDVEIRHINRTQGESPPASESEPPQEAPAPAPAPAAPVAEEADQPARATEAPAPAKHEPDKPEAGGKSDITLLLTVKAPKGHPFSGLEVLEAAQELSLKLNKIGVLDCIPEGRGIKTPVFSIAHLREPGIFELDTIRTLVTPGLLAYIQLPGPLEEVASMDLMIRLVGQLAGRLGGTLCDEQGIPITPQSLLRLRSRAAEFAQRRAR